MYIKNADSGREFVLGKADISMNLIDSLKEPETFENAYYYQNVEEKDKMDRSKFERVQ
jgi:hypothetical protein